VPVSDEALGEITLLGPSAASVWRNHPGYVVEQKIEFVTSALEMFRRCYADLKERPEDFDVAGKEFGVLDRVA
jgi:hypothetical protein